MREDRGLLETVHEKDIDLLLVEEVHASSEFREWFLNAIGQKESNFIGAWRSVTRFNGESDLEVVFENDTGEVVLLLIENKIKADEQPRQAERYEERGQRYVQTRDVDQFSTCIIAPENYLDNNIRTKYDYSLSYERLQSWFAKQGGERYRFKGLVFEEAITLGQKRYIKSTDEETQEFWEFYESEAADYPQLEFTLSHTPASGTTWFRFNPSSMPEEASITHKADRGAVDLSLGGLGQSVGHVRNMLIDLLEDDMSVTRTGKSASIRIAVPAFNELSDPRGTKDAIREGLEAAQRLLVWERNNREQWQQILPPE